MIRPVPQLPTAILCSCALLVIGCTGAESNTTTQGATDDAGPGDDDGTADDGSDADESAGPSGGDDDGDDGSDGDGDGDDGVTDDTGSDPTALGDDVFFFVRDLPDGDALWAYDLATDQAHEVTPLDGTSDIRSIAIHPSRTLVAIASDYDAVDHQDSEAIFAFEIDDDLVFGEPTLLMPPIPKPGAVATGYNQQIDSLRWHPDGSWLWLDHAIQIDFSEPGGGGIVGVDPATGEVSFYGETIGDCAVNTGPSPSPDGSVLLVVRDVCIDSTHEGIAAFEIPPVGEPQLLIPNFEPVFATPHWLPGGTGFVYGAAIDYDSDGDGTNDIYGETILLIDITTGDQFVLLAPAPDAYLWDFTVSPAGDRVVVCVSQNGGRNLLLLDYSVDPPELRWLTDDGGSCTPAW